MSKLQDLIQKVENSKADKKDRSVSIGDTSKRSKTVSNGDTIRKAVLEGVAIEIPLEDIYADENQPRSTLGAFALKEPDLELEDLAASIRSVGLIQPIVVEQLGKKYRIIVGERRWRSCCHNAAFHEGKDKIKVVVWNNLDDTTRLLVQIHETLNGTKKLTRTEYKAALLRLTEEIENVTMVCQLAKISRAQYYRIIGDAPKVGGGISSGQFLKAGDAIIKRISTLNDEDRVKLLEMVERLAQALRQEG